MTGENSENVNVNGTVDTKTPYPYPRSLNKNIWAAYLGRQLLNEEIFILESVKAERAFNDKIKALNVNIKSKNLYIPRLTKLHGNCLFESLYFFNICDEKFLMRKGLAHLMYIYRNHKGLFNVDDPNDSRTPKDIFRDTNEIEFVLCREEDRAYKYSYEAMCQDLGNNYSWTRLPTQLIIMFISKFYNIRFEIHSNVHTFVNVIDMNPNDLGVKRNIALGIIGESHYLPLHTRSGKREEEFELLHQESKEQFFAWASAMETSINSKNEKPPQTTNTVTANTQVNKQVNNNIENKTYVDVTNKIPINPSNFVNFE